MEIQFKYQIIIIMSSSSVVLIRINFAQWWGWLNPHIDGCSTDFLIVTQTQNVLHWLIYNRTTIGIVIVVVMYVVPLSLSLSPTTCDFLPHLLKCCLMLSRCVLYVYVTIIVSNTTTPKVPSGQVVLNDDDDVLLNGWKFEMPSA